MRDLGNDLISRGADERLAQAKQCIIEGNVAEARTLLKQAIDGDGENGVKGYKDIIESVQT